MSQEEPLHTSSVRQQRKAELELAFFHHGFEIVTTDTGVIHIRVSTSHPSSAAEPLMLDYKRDVANYVNHGFGTPHDVAMHFVHRYAFRTQSWIAPLES